MDGFWLIGSGFNTYGTAMSRTTAFALPRGATPWRDPVETSVVSAPNMGFRVVQAIGGLTWYREAHNDYLQLLVEMGMAGFATMLWFLWLLFRNGLRKLRDGPSSVNGGLALATLLGCTGILVHSFVDFNLQVPANAALFYVFAALAASAPLPENHHRRRPPMMA
jgi:hypothetical protein